MARRGALITLLVTVAVAWGGLAAALATGTTPRLGLDLQGGFSVLLEAPEGTSEEVLDKAVEIMRNRIEALGGVQEPEISITGEASIEVQLPGVTDRERALAAVGRTGQLEFRPVEEISSIPGVSPLLLAASIAQQEEAAADDTTTTTLPGDDTTTTTVPGDDTTSTTGAGDETTTTSSSTTTTTTTTVPEEDQPEEEVEPPVVTADLLPDGVTLCDPAVPALDQPGCVDSATGLTPNPDPDLPAWLLNPETGAAYALAPAAVLGSDLSNAESRFVQQSAGGGQAPLGVGFAGPGEWVVMLDFSSEGATKFEDTTKYLAGFAPGDPRRQFAIVLDGDVQSAPQINPDITAEEGITGGQALITLGGAENQEAEASELAIVLRYGALPVAFDQPSVQSVSATLGSDSLQAGLIAGIGGLILVAAAMIAYYRALGLVNVIGLSVFGSLVYVIYGILGSGQGVTLTLAGVAGVIVAIGITSDSYIVYFERIKEEVHGGRSSRAAIEHAFSRAFRTILTADSVSFAGAVLLYTLAIGSVKGFALALGIATVTDVAVAYFYTRPAVALVALTRLGEGGRLSIRGATGEAKEVAA